MKTMKNHVDKPIHEAVEEVSYFKLNLTDALTIRH